MTVAASIWEVRQYADRKAVRAYWLPHSHDDSEHTLTRHDQFSRMIIGHTFAIGEPVISEAS